MLMPDGGVVEGERILPENWITEAGSSKMIGGKNVNYGTCGGFRMLPPIPFTEARFWLVASSGSLSI
jgi:hypothetical protein